VAIKNLAQIFQEDEKRIDRNAPQKGHERRAYQLASFRRN
jgi:hypothetical protein